MSTITKTDLICCSHCHKQDREFMTDDEHEAKLSSEGWKYVPYTSSANGNPRTIFVCADCAKTGAN